MIGQSIGISNAGIQLSPSGPNISHAGIYLFDGKAGWSDMLIRTEANFHQW